MPVLKQSEAIIAALMLLAAATADAQSYPARPLRMVVGAATGGTPDILARIIGPKLHEQLGQPVIVDNRPGATGNIGAEVVAKAAPDGHTMIMATSVLSISPAFYKSLPFDPLTGLAPVSQLVSQAMFLLVPAELGAKSVAEFLKLAKSRSQQLNYASIGNGSPQHVASELLQINAGVKFVHVPYKSGGQMVTALLSNESQLMFLGLSPALGQVKAGRLRVLAVASGKRSAMAPDVPTFTEAGVPGVVLDNWLGVLTTGGTPRAVINKLNAELVKAVRAPDSAERLAQQHLDITASSPADFTAFFKGEIAKVAKVVRTAGIEPQ
ncbi:MAG: tripartite tricarboxylate transporter substrate binding protein [Burkholderiales bacterium]